MADAAPTPAPTNEAVTFNPPIGPGARRAAAVLLGMGPQAATEVFKLLGESEIRRIALGAKELRKAPTTEVADALRNFVDSLERVGGDMAASDAVLRDVAAHALGPDVVRRAFDGAAPPPPPDEVLGGISQADPEALAMVLAREQPQTVALVLGSIDTQLATAVIDRLPEASRNAIIRRMAVIDAVSPEVLREVGQALSAELRAVVAGGMRKVNGKTVAMEILRHCSQEEQTSILEHIEKGDATLASEMRSKLFTFEDIAKLTDRDIQTLLKEVNASRLAIALKGASPKLRDSILKNMSTRASQILADDIAVMGAVRLSLVEEAQQEISKAALSLAEQQKITIVRPNDKMV